MSKIRELILEADDIPDEDVPCPEWARDGWDGTVKVRGLTGTERDAFEESNRQIRPVRGANGKPDGQEVVPMLANVRARLVVKCALDPEDDTRLFTDQDANALGKKSAKVLDRLFDVASRLSGLTEEDIEELAKNSAAAASGDSPSDSPESSDAP